MDEVKRLEWIDYTKGFAITLVVIGHTVGGLSNANLPHPEAYDVATAAIYTFHMPLFFFISGYLSRNILTQTTGNFAKSTVISIVVPYIIWSVVFILINVTSSAATNQLKLVDVERILLPQTAVSVYWFFYCMFLVRLAYFLIGKARSTLVIPLAACFFVMYLFDFLVQQFSPAMTAGEFAEGFFQKMLMGGAFFGAGLIAALKTNVFDLTVSPRLLGIWFAGWIAVTIAIVQRPGLVALAPFAACLGVACFVSLAYNNDVKGHIKIPLLSFIGKASIAIYVSHVIAAAATRVVLIKFGVTDGSIHVLLGTASGIFFPSCLFIMANFLGVAPFVGLGKNMKNLLPFSSRIEAEAKIAISP
jgi:fucose 4-O-acetylase-like acetyltransferase